MSPPSRGTGKTAALVATLIGIATMAFMPPQQAVPTGVELRGPPPELVIGVPKGGIVLWSGSLADIPPGWKLCDGSNATPDLRSRFVVGAPVGTNPGAVGGADSHSHALSGAAASAGSHSHHTNWGEGSGSWVVTKAFGTTSASASTEHMTGFDGTYDNGQPPNSYQAFNTSTDGGHTHDLSGQGSSGDSHLPPYFEIAFIMRG